MSFATSDEATTAWVVGSGLTLINNSTDILESMEITSTLPLGVLCTLHVN